mmetsp:Transcript_10143/g.19866  ORF Transcript_10143/g.19866 Transcript_10143/m.19866 type:complete len:177 (-) Transcript_10143:659-1189(-)
MSTEGGHWRMPSSAAATVKPFVIAFVAVAAICMLSIPASSLHKNGGLRMNSPGISRTGVVGVRRGDCALGKTSRRHHHLQNHIHKSSDVPAHALASQSEGVNRARIEFVEGVAEQAIPEIRLTRSRDGLSGVASFKFESPKVLVNNPGEISGMKMVDDEGVLSTIDIEVLKQINTN